MAALEVLALNTTVPRIEAPQTGDTYTFPRAADIPLGTAALPAVAFTGDLNTGIFSPTADTFAVTTGGTERLRVDSTALTVTHEVAANRMSVATTSGIGVLFLGWANDRTALYHGFDTSYFQRIGLDAAGRDMRLQSNSGDASAKITFWTGAAGTLSERMRLDSAGNLGLGVTPSAWGSIFRSLDIFGGVSLFGGSTQVGVTQNAYFDGANFVYRQSAVAANFRAINNTFQWNIAPSGTAGTTISFTQAMTLDASGNLGLGTSTFGTSAAKVLAIGSGTEPSTGPVDTVQFYSVDRSAGNTIPGIRCEGTGVTDAAITNVTVTNKIAMKVNGTIYYLLATTSAA